MKFTRVLAVICLVIVMVSSASAFNGLRKGFVIGGGLGLAPAARYHCSTFSVNKFGGCANLFLGYAWDEHNMIVYETNAAGVQAGTLDYGQGFAGPIWYHYFGQLGKSVFAAAGFGYYYFRLEGEEAIDPNIGFMIGGGYEFARHLQAAMYLSVGRTNLDFFPVDIEFSHVNFNIIVSAVAF